MGDEGPERVADVVAHDQIGDVVEVGRLAIDDDERAPFRLAINGKPAAGHTTSEEPIARNRSQVLVNSSARRIASAGIAWPNETVAVLMKPPHRAVGRAARPSVEFFLHPRNS